MKMFLCGEWKDSNEKIEVRNPYDQTIIDTVPAATASDVELAVSSLVQGAEIMRNIPAYERYQMLHKASQLMRERQEELGRIISKEEGKILAEGIGEAGRSTETIEVSAEEAKRITGEVLPLDAASNGKGKFGFTLRVPCGVVAAITPFNFPLNLVCHKVGPALAAGNAVLLKPASDTPLCALTLVEILLEAGIPPLAIAAITGSGSKIGDAICKDSRIRKISFTGSRDVGEKICQSAGLKRVTMELGSNSPLVVMDDADLEKVAHAAVVTGFANAGQVCISAQRVIASEKIYDELLDRMKAKTEAILTGNQLDESVNMGPMVRQSDAERVESWIQDAVSQGAKIICGGERDQSVVSPTVLADVSPSMKISCEELFGPAVGVTKTNSIEDALKLATDTNYGLSAAIFTQDIDKALRFAQEVPAGNIHINWGPMWRADFMPYGGLKESGMGKEGPKYAIQEMTELKMVVVH